MAVHLDFDFVVEAGFYYLGRWPIALMQGIGEKKAEMFAALQPNPLVRDQFTASGCFVVQGREFRVTFGANRDLLDRHILRVLHIEP